MSTTTTIDYEAADAGVASRSRARGRALLVAAAVFALAVASADLLTYQVNLPIIYTVPLLLVESRAAGGSSGRPRLRWSALTFAGDFFGRHLPGLEPLDIG